MPEDNSDERRTGWRLFSCTDCERVWWAATRDRRSPSADLCTCGNPVTPLEHKPDTWLPVDGMGNLVGDITDKILRYGRRSQ